MRGRKSIGGAVSPRILLAGALLAAAGVAPALVTGPLPEPVGRGFAEVEQLLKSGGADDARAALDLARVQARQRPGDPKGQSLLGLALLAAGETGPAEQVFLAALEWDPGRAEAHLGLGRIALGRNEAREARAHLSKATASGGFRGEAWNDLRRLHAAQGDFQAAREAASRVIDLLDETPGARAGSLQSNLEHYRLCGPGPHLRIPESFLRITVPLLRPPPERRRRIQEIEILVNGQGPFLFDIDSAYRGNMILSPELADRLTLRRAGSFGGAGVGPARKILEGSHLERIRIGNLDIESVPVQVMESPTFGGNPRGLIGTNLLKLFHVVIDVKAGTMELIRGDRPDLLEAGIDRSRVHLAAPAFIAGAPLVPVGVNGGPPVLFMVDTAASVTLLDERYYQESIAEGIRPEEIQRIQIRGSGGAEEALMLPSAALSVAGADLGDTRVVILDMTRINAMRGIAVNGILGADRLWGYRVHLNFARPSLVLERQGDGA